MDGDTDERRAMLGPLPRLLGLAWVAVSLPVIVAAGALVQTTDQYVFVLVFVASGAYTTPGLVAGWFVVRHPGCPDRDAYAMLVVGLALIYGSVAACSSASSPGGPGATLSGCRWPWSWAQPT